MDDEQWLRALMGDRPGGDVELRHRDGRAYLVLRNEFATVWVGIDRDDHGARLVVTDAEAGTRLALDPLELEAVSRFSHRDFDAWILERSGSLPEAQPAVSKGLTGRKEEQR
jgi:hypothetical protein